MKKTIGLIIAVASFAANAFTESSTFVKAQKTKMHAIESAGEAIFNGIKKGKVDVLFGTDSTSLTVMQTTDGFEVEVIAVSQDPAYPNRVKIYMDSSAKVNGMSQVVSTKNPNGPVFTGLDAGSIIDLAAEAIVDHLVDVPVNADLAIVASEVVSEHLSLEAAGPRVKVNLQDGRSYLIQMDNDGKILSQGF